jgi:hypothetical protein
LLHKSDAGAVKPDLSGAGDARRGCEELAGKSAARLTGVLVQPMGSGGTGVIIGVAREPVSGPMVMHGPGGVAARVLSGYSAGLAPLAGADGGRLIRSVRAAAPLPPGRRGAPAAGLTAPSGALLRVSRLAGDSEFPVRSCEAATAVTRPAQLAAPAPRRGSEYAQLSRQVRQAGLLERRPGYYVWKIAVTIGLLAAGWTVFVVAGDSWWQLAVAAFLAVVFTQIGFLGHDAGHRQVFASRRASYVAGLLLGNLGIGLSCG